MIHAMVVSKDRACQLDALLQSIYKYAPNIFNIDVVYKYSNSFYADGYAKLIRLPQHQHYDIKWIPENTFRDSVIQSVEESNSSCCALLTDDSIFFDFFPISDHMLSSIFETRNCKTFSPRCGFNTKQQCHWEPIFQKEIEPVWENNSLVMWDFTKHDYSTDYGRPVSLDGNINDRRTLLEMMKTNDWNWCGGLDGMNTGPLQPYMMSYKKSILTNIPVNSTHGSYATNWGKFYTFTFEELNQAFLDGKRININKMDFSNVIGGHQEIEYILE